MNNTTGKATHISQLTKEQQAIAMKYKAPVQPGAISNFYARFEMVKEMQELHKFAPFDGSLTGCFNNCPESFVYDEYNFMSEDLQYCIPAKFFEKEKLQVEVWLLIGTSDVFYNGNISAFRVNDVNRKSLEREIKEGRFKLLNKTFIEVEDNR